MLYVSSTHINYWLELDVEQTFFGYLSLLKAQYYHPKASREVGVIFAPLLDDFLLDQ
jgi:hypothetical protein